MGFEYRVFLNNQLFACKWRHRPYLAKLWFLGKGLMREAAIKGFVAFFGIEVVTCRTTQLDVRQNPAGLVGNIQKSRNLLRIWGFPARLVLRR
jgi:hypothetical protein